MPPKRRSDPERGGEPLLYQTQQEDLESMMTRHGMTRAEAMAITILPVAWAQQLASDRDPEEVCAEIAAEFARLEETYGQSEDWDDMRVAAALGLMGADRLEEAAELLASVVNIVTMMEHMSDFLANVSARGAFSAADALTMDILLANAFVRCGRQYEFAELVAQDLERRAGELFAEHTHDPNDLGRLAEQDLTGEQWAVAGKALRPQASWEALFVIVGTDTDWPDDTGEVARRTVAGIYADIEEAMLQQPIERKEVERLKAMLKECESATPALVWDKLRIVAAIALYEAEAPKFGRGMARAMNDPEAVGTLCVALIGLDREREAFDVAWEITSPQLFAEVIYMADWSDRAPVDTLLDDLTQVTPNTRRKYDPQLRVGVAEGLAGLFRDQLALAEEAGEDGEPAAASWRELHANMERRAALLRRQIASRYISAPVKKR